MKAIIDSPSHPWSGTALRWVGCVLPVLVCLLLGTGCNKGSSAGKGIVAGKVTLGGKGVGPDATVAFFSSDGKQIAEAPTTDTGDYLMPEVPMGSVKIAVLRRTPIQGAAMVKMDPSMPGA